MSNVEIVSEEEDRAGWSFRVRVGAAAPRRSRLRTVRLSWADYDLWSADGADPPHAVAAAVARFVLSQMALSDVPATIDASTLRRRFPGADREIPTLIRR